MYLWNWTTQVWRHLWGPQREQLAALPMLWTLRFTVQAPSLTVQSLPSLQAHCKAPEREASISHMSSLGSSQREGRDNDKESAWICAYESCNLTSPALDKCVLLPQKASYFFSHFFSWQSGFLYFWFRTKMWCFFSSEIALLLCFHLHDSCSGVYMPPDKKLWHPAYNPGV